MKKLFFYTLALFCFITNAQTKYFYYYNGNKIPLKLDTNNLNIISDDIKSIPTSRIYTPIEQDNKSYIKMQSVGNVTEREFESQLENLKKASKIVGLYFKNGEKSIGTSKYFYVKIKRPNDFQVLKNFSSERNVEIISNVPNMPLWYILAVTDSKYTSLEMSNLYYESKLFSDIDPAFIFDFKGECANDPYFKDLWGLGSINICKAWNLSTGSGVNVAVVDHGIDKSHNDLRQNIHPLSFNTVTGKIGSDFKSNKIHGTHVAGIISAVKDNYLQVVGVAPDAKIMSVSNPLVASENISAELASGISWAWKNGADVINNSWGDQGGSGYEKLHSKILEDAISEAIAQGRNGKGTIVLFASGNFSPKIDYPAYANPDILVIGSIQSNKRRSNSSGYGRELDVVAPGVGILSTIPNNSVSSEDGTSMACPHVAGVAALILSVNPDLTVKQVADIIEQTAQKVGGYNYQNTYTRPNGTWNNQMGYGLVDAYKALQKATIAGTDEFCLKTDATFELIAPIPNDATIKWEDPEYKLEIVSGQGTKSCVFRGTYWDGNRTIKAVVTYKDGTVKSFEKEVYVNNDSEWKKSKPTISNHPQSPYGIPCCGGSTNIIKHVILTSYPMGKIEWENTILHKDPNDFFEFKNSEQEVEILAIRRTQTPFVVSTRARFISDCRSYSRWSDPISRYYGAIVKTSFRSASAYNSPVKSTNEDIPVYEFFTNRASILRVQTEDLQQWLDAKYSGKELNDKELQKVLYYLNNRDNLDKIGVKVFDFSGKRILQGDLDFGKSLDFNMSRYAKGFYIITYEFGSISNGKVIYKP
ncbi:S8 family serine peptidase [uncultured Capnocytophaga sp.]|uniref:S8 family peptidase n=1 Tax=uncultured Capnocytophaga sp. TaxID=159273 RepID=UPI002593112B|nr:S8 family serine peptidase [uncultured Capnocytophaga sp.]